MKRRFFVLLIAALAFLTLSVSAQIIEEPQDEPDNTEMTAPKIKMGVTPARFDNVSQILRHFGSEVDFETASFMNAESFDGFYAVFINCGSQNHVNPRALRAFVEKGGIVYASDHAAEVLLEAFPDMFAYTDAVRQVVQAGIMHSTLAAHMDMREIDIIFDLDSWYALTELSDEANVYMRGYVAGFGELPLAMSFNYGEGTVFFTSFHNSAQATSHMIDFIEYLVFRIIHIEADRNLAAIAQERGFQYQGQVFGRVTAAPPAPMPQSGSSNWDAWNESDASMPMPPSEFRYHFDSESFIIMLGSSAGRLAITLTDPDGHVYTISETGEITMPSDLAPDALPEIELIEDVGIQVTNGIHGEWLISVTAAPDDEDDFQFYIGIATAP